MTDPIPPNREHQGKPQMGTQSVVVALVVTGVILLAWFLTR